MKAARRAAEKSAEVYQFIWKHKQGFLIVIALFLVVSIFLNGMSSCSMLAEGVMSVLGGSTHPSSDEAMLGAEAAYTGMENELQSYLDSYESTHDYDEYSYDLDEIGHDPYVWGGSSPSTSFDCSGFVSWVINHSGWNYGRLGAQGLCNVCTPVSPANARPGDLVFFKYTYDAPNPDGVTHCGIYVGNGMMIHCGSPISYANLNTSYW